MADEKNIHGRISWIGQTTIGMAMPRSPSAAELRTNSTAYQPSAMQMTAEMTSPMRSM